MADNNLIFTITYFPDPTTGRPVALGSVFIGIPGLDPEVEANRVTVNLKEEDGTLVPIPPASQPLLLSAGGTVDFNGSPVQVIVDGDYSIKVLDSLGGQVYYLSDVTVPPPPPTTIDASNVIYTAGAGSCTTITETNVQDALTELCEAVETKADGIQSDFISFPPGMIVAYSIDSFIAGTLFCDGQNVSRTTYSTLFSLIGTDYGIGDGSTTFTLPDFRGEFLRGWDDGAGNDPDAGSRTDRGDGTVGDNVGTKQSDAFRSHDHDGVGNQQNNGDAGANQDVRQLNGTTNATGGNETRPINVYVQYIITTGGQ